MSFFYEIEITDLITIGEPLMTERGCDFSEDAEVGDKLDCNFGVSEIFISTDEYSTILLAGYTCYVTEVLTKEIDGFSRSYSTENSTNRMIPGIPIRLTVILKH